MSYYPILVLSSENSIFPVDCKKNQICPVNLKANTVGISFLDEKLVSISPIEWPIENLYWHGFFAKMCRHSNAIE